MKLDKVGPGSSRKQAFTVAFRGRGRAGGVEYLFFLVSSFVIKSFQGKAQLRCTKLDKFGWDTSLNTSLKKNRQA